MSFINFVLVFLVFQVLDVFAQETTTAAWKPQFLHKNEEHLDRHKSDRNKDTVITCDKIVYFNITTRKADPAEVCQTTLVYRIDRKGDRIAIDCSTAQPHISSGLCEQKCSVPRKDYYDKEIVIYSEPGERDKMSKFTLKYGRDVTGDCWLWSTIVAILSAVSITLQFYVGCKRICMMPNKVASIVFSVFNSLSVSLLINMLCQYLARTPDYGSCFHEVFFWLMIVSIIIVIGFIVAMSIGINKSKKVKCNQTDVTQGGGFEEKNKQDIYNPYAPVATPVPVEKA